MASNGDTVLTSLVIRDEGEAVSTAPSGYRLWSFHLVVQGAFYRIGRPVVGLDVQDAAQQFAKELAMFTRFK